MIETILIVSCTVPDNEEAKLIARTLLKKKLAACCNIIPAVQSVYYWEGDIKESDESMLVIKTTQKSYEQLEKEIKMIHSYSVPEIIATKIETGSPAYIDWILESVDRKGL
jgi:periplasmic divalent cation tolerance protein